MSRFRTRFALSLATAAAVAGLSPLAAGAAPAEPSYDELKAQLQQLQSRIETLERTDVASQSEVNRTVEELVKDAGKRSQLLATDATLTAGYDKGFFIRSADGNFVLKPGVQFQFRNVTNYRSEDEDGDDSLENGFEVRRLRFRFDGNVFTPKLTYQFQWDTSRTNGGVSLLDAWAQYQFTDKWAVKVGQFKESVFHERDISGFAQLAVDRSLADAVLGGAITDRVQGLSLIYGGKEADALRIETAFHDGANSRNTNFQDDDSNFGVGGRAEYKLFGNWADYKDFTARATKKQLLVVGGGAEWTQEGDGDAVLTTLDAQYKTDNGWSVYGALHGNFLTAGDDDSFDWGALAQVGYALNQQWEPFARYDLVSVEDDGGDDDVYNEFTAGVNYYLGENGSHGHRAKLSFDAVFLPDGAPSDQTGLGILASDDAEFVFRAQFQLIL